MTKHLNGRVSPGPLLGLRAQRTVADDDQLAERGIPGLQEIGEPLVLLQPPEEHHGLPRAAAHRAGVRYGVRLHHELIRVVAGRDVPVVDELRRHDERA